MNLFDVFTEEIPNLLPYDGEVNYFGVLFTPKQMQILVKQLINSVEWQHDEIILFGKKITTKRKVAWYGDQNFEYTYSHVSKKALPWTTELLSLKQLIEQKTNQTFNSCLLNLYHNGQEGMGWHSDNEKELKKNGAIASVSLGATRKFSLKHKTTKQIIPIDLENGSLLLMKGATQEHWLHRLHTTTKCSLIRINLTFRTIKV